MGEGEVELAVGAWTALESIAYGAGGLKGGERELVNEYVVLFPPLDGLGNLAWSSLEGALGMCARLREQKGYEWLAEVSYLGPGRSVRREYFFIPNPLGERLVRSMSRRCSLSAVPVVTDVVPRWLVENLLMAYHPSVIHTGLFKSVEDEVSDYAGSPDGLERVAAPVLGPVRVVECGSPAAPVSEGAPVAEASGAVSDAERPNPRLDQ
jgi:hypothetical protein